VNAAPWVDELCRKERLPVAYGDTVRQHIATLGAKITALQNARQRTVVIGICGAQGSGKSTLALFLENWLRRESGVAATTLSLDDVYLDKQARKELADSRHPLLRTRGVPGTHDVGLAKETLRQLTLAEGTVVVPVFDKAADDRLPESQWRSVATPVDVVLFEGWCVGTRPQSDEELATPVNALEADTDTDGAWRRYVNDRLKGDYASLFEALDVLVLLRVPSFDKVLEWRGLQEEKLRGSLDQREIERFTRHFERLTRHTLASMPGYANALIDIDDEHRLASLAIADWPGD
jgi:D-glycerate 3-kinase